MRRGAWNLVAKWRIMSDVIACGRDISSMGNDGRVDSEEEVRIDSRTDHCRWLRRYATVICCWLIVFVVMVCYCMLEAIEMFVGKGWKFLCGIMKTSLCALLPNGRSGQRNSGC